MHPLAAASLLAAACVSLPLVAPAVLADSLPIITDDPRLHGEAIVTDGFDTERLQPPKRVRIDGVPLDCGPSWGHASPCWTDVTGDGLPDLVVGDFSDYLTVYRNTGERGDDGWPTLERVAEHDGRLQAGGEDAKVWIYCCIGAQARPCDLNGDGHTDLLVNSYDPGHAYLFPGNGDGTFEARVELTDENGTPVRSQVKQRENYLSFGSFYEAVDWDNDGDEDLLIGDFGGPLHLRENIGSATEYVFAGQNMPVTLASGEPLKVEKHNCPVAADWDGDGLWDLICGADDGSVTLFRNIGAEGEPALAEGLTLVEPASAERDNGYDIYLFDAAGVRPGIRTQPEVVDWDGDGRVDLLVGDFSTAYAFREDLTAQQIAEIRTAYETHKQEIDAVGLESMDDLRNEGIEKFGEENLESDEATEWWEARYAAWRESDKMKQVEALTAAHLKSLRPFLAGAHGESDWQTALPHGYVWVYRQQGESE